MTTETKGKPELWLDVAIEELQQSPSYVAEGMANGVVQQIEKEMRRQGMTRSQLAEAMGVRRSYVSRVLNGHPNLTLRSIAAVAIALGMAEPVVKLSKRGITR